MYFLSYFSSFRNAYYLGYAYDIFLFFLLGIMSWPNSGLGESCSSILDNGSGSLFGKSFLWESSFLKTIDSDFYLDKYSSEISEVSPEVSFSYAIFLSNE